jgi:hypothetical protein
MMITLWHQTTKHELIPIAIFKWDEANSDLVALDFSLPHVAICVFPELGDPFDSFPSLHFSYK